MRAKAGVIAPRRLWGNVALLTRWVKRGGTGKMGNSGPSGRLLRPAAKRYRSLADMAASYGVVNGIKKGAAVRQKVRE